ncbi:MAG: HAMP domain-containing protein [Chlorobi bacterium]|nr:HAMP domain-containing protein [Chlorobiota bacterium]
MKRYSFRLIISITIFLVVSTMSFFALFLFNSYMSREMYKHAEEDIYSSLSIMHAQFLQTISQVGGKALHPLLDSFKKNKYFYRLYLFNSNDSLVYLSGPDSLSREILGFKKISELPEDTYIQSYKDGNEPGLWAYIRFRNSPECYQCHHSSKKYLGMLVFDITLERTNQHIALMRNFSLGYSAMIVFLVLASAFLVHYRLVRRSLNSFHNTINRINKGNLNERIAIPKSRELAELGKSFNEMVDTFQKTQQQLQIYHQKELDDKRKMATIGEMASRLAHEIRNPLTGIANAAEILVRQVPEDENKPILEEIRRQAERVNNAITNMLRFSRPSGINPEMNNINDVIRTLIFFIRNQTRNKKIEFRQELQEDIPLFPFDNEKIENVLHNLGLNAIRAIPQKGVITFKTAYDPENKKVTIIVEDTGTGIPKDVLENIFNPFYTTHTEGTGLGLAISKEIVEKHKGRIRVESEESKGTRFYVILPTG